VYEGAYDNDAPTGKGSMRFVSGSRFSGDFRGGLFHGHGTYTDANGGTRRW